MIGFPHIAAKPQRREFPRLATVGNAPTLPANDGSIRCTLRTPPVRFNQDARIFGSTMVVPMTEYERRSLELLVVSSQTRWVRFPRRRGSDLHVDLQSYRCAPREIPDKARSNQRTAVPFSLRESQEPRPRGEQPSTFAGN